MFDDVVNDDDDVVNDDIVNNDVSIRRDTAVNVKHFCHFAVTRSTEVFLQEYSRQMKDVIGSSVNFNIHEI